ncbi:hypothetical protein N7532_004592 [Penicillium argentinense]|uniref:Trafficking protein particle complex subunit 12 n=1 Tax=Penicillium argentinense TaxID=1131581 RepID=A0A9W9FPL3_9EURO|nr:uncharacterized protein N7532_004592 [Penicillium argentinense]KAJ5104063.1 hypothetical protein N7532_004592 [Penicillium argentinense]
MHNRNASRSSRPRSSTRGPLDASDDPLSSPGSAPSPSMNQQIFTGGNDCSGASLHKLDPLSPDELPETHGKDLSFLLRHNIYHPLSHIDVPSPLRSDFVVLNPGEPLSTSLGALEKLLVEGRFLIAAHFAGSILTSSLVSPTDIKIIFCLFYTRLACLELSGNTVLAAQESKALEDLNSQFYYIDPRLSQSEGDNKDRNDGEPDPFPRHIVPWPLRVLAVRLQSIGFGDSRRSIGGLYEIGLEARSRIMKRDISESERKIWIDRLADLGIRSVNALVEMGDLDAAKRIGDLDAAEGIFEGSGGSKEAAMLTPLLSMSDGRYQNAIDEWRMLLEDNQRTDGALVAQNLAVCLLYTGQLDEARQLLESQISANHSFSSLIFNLSTVYELCSDNAGQLKGQLALNISNQPISGRTNLDRSNADFKLGY